MFYNARSFNQHLNWNTSRVSDMDLMFEGSGGALTDGDNDN